VHGVLAFKHHLTATNGGLLQQPAGRHAGETHQPGKTALRKIQLPQV